MLNPELLDDIRKKKQTGKTLNEILDNYHGDFLQDILKHYYHLNGGPDLRDYQIDALDECKNFFEKNTNGRNYNLLWCCGLGKTKMVLTMSKKLNAKTILIGVPSLVLMDQICEDIKLFYPLNSIFKLFSKKEIEDRRVLKPDNLRDYLLSDNRFKIVVSTYHSSNKILDISKDTNTIFDLVILDEAHHLLDKKQKIFNKILDVRYSKRINLTATPNLEDDNEKMYSFKNSEEFKGINNIKSIDWAIKNKYVTDYNILVINDNEYDIDKSILQKYDNLELIISAYVGVKAIIDGISSKILIYCNRVVNAKKIKNIINDILIIKRKNGIELDLGNYELNGSDSFTTRNNVLKDFKEKEQSILSSVQIFGEGFDYPDLDSVIFAEKMTSPIRIVQSALRPCRISKKNTNKKANIFLPVTKEDTSKLKQFLLKMKTIDSIISKINVIKMEKSKKLSILKCKNDRINDNDLLIDDDIFNYLGKIKLEYLRNELEESNIDVSFNQNFKKKTANNIILCPVSDISFVNYYKTIFIKDKENENCMWGFKNGLKSQWEKLKKDDYICLVEKKYITIGFVQTTYISKKKSLENWNDECYLLIVEFKFYKRIKIEKREFMTKIGCKSTDNLMGGRIYNGKQKKFFWDF
jgi:superfamily II DNA or RNA helicase